MTDTPYNSREREKLTYNPDEFGGCEYSNGNSCSHIFLDVTSFL